MARRKGPRRYRPTHYWTMVERFMHCALGDHTCLPGTQVRIRREDPVRRASCAACLKRLYGVDVPTPQARPVTINHATTDVRARQVGGSHDDD